MDSTVRQPFSALLKAFIFYSTIATASQPRCDSSKIARPCIEGAQLLDLKAIPVSGYSISVPQAGANPSFATNYTGLEFCNVTVTYTHPGKNDTIHTLVWLPLVQKWNGRFMSTGGSGFSTGMGPFGLSPALSEGYATAQTDGGHPAETDDGAGETDVNADPSRWALDAQGKVNQALLDDFAYVAIGELSLIGKAITQGYYGKAPTYSYWNGCSTGGGQGLDVAQRYPEQYDGILALSPAINWPSFVPAVYWPQLVMNNLHYYAPACELDAITQAAVLACDELDGVKDGIISNPDKCHFNAHSVVGQSYNCSGSKYGISTQAAKIANEAWAGPSSPSGEHLWYGLERGTSLSRGQALTVCNGTTAATCTGEPFAVPVGWIPYFVEKNSSYNLTAMTATDFTRILKASVQEYQSVIGTANPDLSAFRAHGGKMLTAHGLADELISPKGSVQYYQSVLHCDPNAADFYRLFLEPGVGHCGGESGPFPVDQLGALVRWVEKGEAPDMLVAVQKEDGITRNLCPFPLVQTYVGGDPKKPESFACKS